MELLLTGNEAVAVLGIFTMFVSGLTLLGPKRLGRMIIRLSRRLKKLKLGPIEAEFTSERDAFSTNSTTNRGEASSDTQQ